MPKLELKNLDNEVVGELELYEKVFAAKVNKSLLFAAVKHHLDSLRQGTHATKTRGLVRGGGKKPWRQKGTGRARFGSTRNPIWRGGGITFGPTGEENYSKQLNTKAKRTAIRQALTFASAANKITVIEDIVSKE